MKKIYPPTHFHTYLLISIILHFLIPWGEIIGAPLRYVGILIIIAGAIITIWADRIFKQRKTTVKPDETPSVLLTDGPYKISRNPMYLGMAGALLGVAIVLGSIAAFVGPVFFIIVMEAVFIPEEERNMRETFGVKYEEYCRRVRRWL